MDIHVVQPGDTLYRLARQYGVPMDRLLHDNQLPDPSQLVVGQTIVIRYPTLTYTVKEGDTLWSIAQAHASTVRALLRNNPNLQGKDLLYPGQVLVIQYQDRPQGSLVVNSYAYPWIDRFCALPTWMRTTVFPASWSISCSAATRPRPG